MVVIMIVNFGNNFFREVSWHFCNIFQCEKISDFIKFRDIKTQILCSQKISVLQCQPLHLADIKESSWHTLTIQLTVVTVVLNGLQVKSVDSAGVDLRASLHGGPCHLPVSKLTGNQRSAAVLLPKTYLKVGLLVLIQHGFQRVDEMQRESILHIDFLR